MDQEIRGDGIIFHEETGVALLLHAVETMIRRAGADYTNDKGNITINGISIKPVFINNYGWCYVLKDVRAAIEKDDE